MSNKPQRAAPERADLARRLLATLDLTRLEDDPDDSAVRALCRRATESPVPPAAVCVPPKFLAAAREVLGTNTAIRLATVANFPAGRAEPRIAALECEQAVALGADEVDVVFPWRALLDGDEAVGADLVTACRDAVGQRALKVILESGMLNRPHLIRRAAEIAIHAGADFVKTSTGKVATNATPQAAKIMLEAIHTSHRPVGLKVSGGVRAFDDARGYHLLAAQLMGEEWVVPEHFRIGASSLLDALLVELEPR